MASVFGLLLQIAPRRKSGFRRSRRRGMRRIHAGSFTDAEVFDFKRPVNDMLVPGPAIVKSPSTPSSSNPAGNEPVDANHALQSRLSRLISVAVHDAPSG